ncbi:glycosyltransferase family 2 protein [Moritella sp. 28]|uniref:glycosyltransferase family 2 protein n=1 Tax=Moritella sp. 28 TaxID=2746232 RepID=UPI001BA698CD|nr:glycosyltransferase family 2 protein [Moritella sp. 28]QUM83562.1 glycosyltransferase family 2 protein [Moritella sp. 28]
MFSYSVLICTYNGVSYIQEQIDSILNQKIKPEMIYLSDDSKDSLTINECIKAFDTNKYSDYEIVKGPGKGAAKNFLHGIKFNTSDFLFLSDQDDIWVENKIAKFQEAVVLTREPQLWYTDSQVIDEQGNVISDSFFRYQGLSDKVFFDDSILYKNAVQGATCCINRSLCELLTQSLSVINIDDILMHDWWLALLAKYYGKVSFINESLIKYRQHDMNEVGASSKRKNILKIVKNPSQYLEVFYRLQKQHLALLKLFKYVPSNLQLEYTFNYKYCGFFKRSLIHFVAKYHKHPCDIRGELAKVNKGEHNVSIEHQN